MVDNGFDPAAFETGYKEMTGRDIHCFKFGIDAASAASTAALALDFLQYRSEDEFIFLKWSPVTKAACVAIVLFWVFIVTGGDFEQPFVYQAF